VIGSFKDDRTRAAFEGEAAKVFPADLLAVTRRKLGYLNAATTLNESQGAVWTAEGPQDVEFVDDH
jgi:proteic killer suppression protein